MRLQEGAFQTFRVLWISWPREELSGRCKMLGFNGVTLVLFCSIVAIGITQNPCEFFVN